MLLYHVVALFYCIMLPYDVIELFYLLCYYVTVLNIFSTITIYIDIYNECDHLYIYIDIYYVSYDSKFLMILRIQVCTFLGDMWCQSSIPPLVNMQHIQYHILVKNTTT